MAVSIYTPIQILDLRVVPYKCDLFQAATYAAKLRV